MSTWNYRLTVQTVNGEDEWALRELYYNEAGDVVNWTKDPIAPTGDSWYECFRILAMMSTAIGQPSAYDLDAGCWCDRERRPMPAPDSVRFAPEDHRGLPETMFRTTTFDDSTDGQLTQVAFRPIDEAADQDWYDEP